VRSLNRINEKQGSLSVWKKGDVQQGHDTTGSLQSKREQLEYVSDLLLELKRMAHQHNLSTLEGILDLARAEARLRSRDLR
jgi:hypothetical protein